MPIQQGRPLKGRHGMCHHEWQQIWGHGCASVVQVLVAFSMVAKEARGLAKVTDRALDDKRRKMLADMVTAAAGGGASAVGPGPAASAAAPTAAVSRQAACRKHKRCAANTHLLADSCTPIGPTAAAHHRRSCVPDAWMCRHSLKVACRRSLSRGPDSTSLNAGHPADRLHGMGRCRRPPDPTSLAWPRRRPPRADVQRSVR